ncbi:hypothetical protein [Arenibacter aquaticus]|nr:hypothetical protein [Arenibacter aquaticus]
MEDADKNKTSIKYINEKGDRENKLDKKHTYWLQSDGSNWHLIFEGS